MSEKETPDGPQVATPPALYPALGIGIAYFLQLYLPLYLPGSIALKAAAWCVFVLALLLIGWALTTLRKFKTTTLAYQASRYLVTTGPYRFSKNPMYLGFILLMVASALATANAWILLSIAPTLWLLSVYTIGPEEDFLRKQFGSSYQNYSVKVRRWL